MNNRNKRTEDCHDNRRSRDSLNSKVHDLNIRVDSLSSTCQNLEEEVATLKLQISQLKQELKEVKETNKQSNKKRVYGHDPTTMTYLRTLYSNCVANGYRWEVDKTLLDKHSTNKQLYDRLVELMVKKLVPDDMEGKEQKVNEIKLAVRKHHEVLRYDANITQERRQRHKMNNKFRYKRLKKLRKRLHVYNKLKITGQFQHEYGNEEQIMPYLNQLYMSDEEENELVIDADTKYSTHVKRYVPKWRSRKVKNESCESIEMTTESTY
ncbi:hypothetical protein BDB01DRAFT_815721 [Pilobolus umbonatus]|nr:hypothetical protein BDB01DRAFT_815721 [Pilobolus umbonatus]